ncbi:copper chaperone PCu(A)C [Xanthomonas nasturtii]|uniref:copper chaperone PCu(A)C n=1 Tax=Xanthomonas TaxID=338 RepID=UPI002B23DD41|nr:copper chaperone PCu(A)C [Xanthomonas nasturtii]MEA9556006.1 copper chaperone PCu(A)C [Xanthomonas nasturtii]
MIDGSDSRRRMRRSVIGAVALLVSAGASAQCMPTFKDGWVRIPPPVGVGMAAGFGSFHNDCPHAVRMTGIKSAAFSEVSLHQTLQTDGVSRMRAVPELLLVPGAVVTLAPGGLHLMLMQEQAPLKEGAQVPVVFILQDGRQVQATLQARTRAPK